MKENIKKNEPQVRQAYVPANVKIIEVATQRAILESSPNGTEPYERQPW